MQDLAEDNVACRICMDNKDNCVSLFSQDLSKKIMEIAAVQVEKDDGLPDSICTECENDLEKCYEFRLKVQVADKKFRENIKFSQVDIAECNIKQERYHIDDGNFDNADENDSVSMDDEHYNEELDVEQQPRSTGEVEPDPLNHVVVVEEKERKIEMAEYTLGQDDVMSEEPQLKTVEEPAVDPLVCMKEETDAEVMDVDSNQPDPFGPSVSVRRSELLRSPPIAFSSTPRDELEVEMETKQEQVQLQAEQTLYIGNIPLLPNILSDSGSASVHITKDTINQEQTLDSILEVQMTCPDENIAQETFPYNNTRMTPLGSNQCFLKRVDGYYTTVTRSMPTYDTQNSYWDNCSNNTEAVGSIHVNNDNSIQQMMSGDTKANDSSTFPSTMLGQVETITKTKVTQSFSSPTDTVQGREEPNGKSEFFCHVCSIDCGTADLLDEHKIGKEFICRNCTAIFNNHQELETHFYGHRKYTCTSCNVVFYTKADLNQHKRTVSSCKNSIYLRCKICQNRYKHLINLQTHMAKNHPNHSEITQPVTCQICEKILKNNTTLADHLKYSHSVYEHLECDICHTIVLGPERLKLHIKQRHIQPSSLATCPTCNKVFTSRSSSFMKHLESHDGEEIICDTCGAVVKGKTAFKSHILYHQQRTLPCRYCNSHFKTMAEKKKHYNENHKAAAKPVICELCGKEYKTKEILKNHMLIHSDAKPHICEVCGAAFKQRVSLKTHSRIHTDLMKYSCSHCGEGFRWKQTFDKHVLKCESQGGDTSESD